MPSDVDTIQRPRPEHVTISDEPHYLIVLDGFFPSEPIDKIDLEHPPKELVGSYLIG